jgi:hypothetical protein
MTPNQRRGRLSSATHVKCILGDITQLLGDITQYPEGRTSERLAHRLARLGEDAGGQAARQMVVCLSTEMRVPFHLVRAAGAPAISDSL